MRRTIPPKLRFMAKVVKLSSGCWKWVGAVARKTGYGRFTVNNQKRVGAHQFAYEMVYGLVPQGLEVDHLCRNRRCVNPTHLEAVSHRENNYRGIGLSAQNAHKSLCAAGHPFDEKNTYMYKTRYGTQRHCRACHAAAQKHYIATRRAGG